MQTEERSSVIIPLYICSILIAAISLFMGMVMFRRVPPPPSVAELHVAWRTAVVSDVEPLLHVTPSTDQIRRTKENLLALKIASQDRDAHLGLVMALVAYERGAPGALERLKSAYASSTIE